MNGQKVKGIFRIVSFVFVISLLVFGVIFAYVLGKSTVATKVPGEVEVNGKAVANAEIFRSNVSGTIVYVDGVYYLLFPFELIKGDTFWRLGGNLVSWREIYSNSNDIFIETYKWEEKYEPKLEEDDAGRVSFTTPDGARISVLVEPPINMRAQ